MANKARGEVTLELGGKSYVLRPEFGVVAEIEDALGSNLFKIGQRLEGVDFTATELLDTVTAFLAAAGQSVEPEAIKAAIAEQGALQVVGVLISFCRNYAFGGGQEKKEDESRSSETAASPETLPDAS